MKHAEFLNELSRCTGATQKAFGRLTISKNRNSSLDEMAFAIAQVKHQLDLEFRLAYGDPVRDLLSDPEKRAYINALIRKVGRPASNGHKAEVRFFGEDDNSLGTAAAVGESVANELFNLLALNGAWARLGVVPTYGKATKFPIMTARPAANFIPTEGGELDDDAVTAGVSVSADTALCGALLTISNELIQDMESDLADQFLTAFEAALNYRLDYAMFQGDGTDDATNGKITGIIPAVTANVITAASGNTTVQAIGRGDLISTVSAIDGPAMQRKPTWFANPGHVGPLLQITEGGRPVLKTALEEASTEMFSLAGFPLVLTGGMPSTNAAATKVLVFGHGRGYGVGLRQGFELQAAPHTKFSRNETLFRALIRAGGKMRRSGAFSVLKTAAV